MSWEPEIEELERRRALVEGMGGPEGIARQHQNGKMTVRERIAALADPGSFRPFMSLAGSGKYDCAEMTSFVPRAAVDGICKLDGRKVVVTAGDFTVRGGSGGSSSNSAMGMELAANRRALEWRLPYVRLLDAAGGSVRTFEEMGRTYLPDGNAFTAPDVHLLSAVPVVSAVMGSVAGLPAIHACLAHFNLMVKGTSQLFPGGPPVVKAALGYDITKEELGGEQIHTRISGVVDNLANDEEDAFRMIKRFLSYLPSNVWEMAPHIETGDDPERRDESLLSLIPRDRKRAYDAHKLIDRVVDKGTFFEIAPMYGRARVTGLARMNGYPVGVMANNMMFGGSTDIAAGEKTLRLIQLCDTFHLPLISFADEPGFMVGLEAEKHGIERAGARLVIGTVQQPDAVGDSRGRPALWRGRPVPAPSDRHVPPLCLAIGELGLDAHRRRRRGSLSPRNCGRPRPGSKTRGNRGDAEGNCLAIPNRGGHRAGHYRPARDADPPLRIRGGRTADPAQSARPDGAALPAVGQR